MTSLWRHYDVIKQADVTFEQRLWVSIHVVSDYASKNENQVKKFCKKRNGWRAENKRITKKSKNQSLKNVKKGSKSVNFISLRCEQPQAFYTLATYTLEISIASFKTVLTRIISTVRVPSLCFYKDTHNNFDDEL